MNEIGEVQDVELGLKREQNVEFLQGWDSQSRYHPLHKIYETVKMERGQLCQQDRLQYDMDGAVHP